MFKDGPYSKHWALYVERPFPDEEESFICHVTGSAGNFQYEDKNNHARTSNRIYKLYFLGHISESDLDNLRNVCRSLLVNNGDATWNCQNFVWDAFGALVEAGLLRPAQGVDKRTIWDQMDGV
ncbi:hypothetical protein QBC37DRAFT_297302 [Rhypophila decipiens]|uniref:Uncharacterized protein n=1 Tax=Rhypophila decipiens TaxID=261697 RepID=A0AAN7B2R4_9PEZI|nr:hypothetical protein QBC37DRAFT_297302 [Rhypophila decipiens]